MQPPNDNEDAMMGEEEYESTQQTQSTQPLSQVPQGIDSHIWGFLQPCSVALQRIDFWKSVSVYDIGRNPDGNVIVLPGFKVSAYIYSMPPSHSRSEPCYTRYRQQAR